MDKLAQFNIQPWDGKSFTKQSIMNFNINNVKYRRDILIKIVITNIGCKLIETNHDNYYKDREKITKEKAYNKYLIAMNRYKSYKELFESIDLRNYIDIPMIINVHDMSIFNYDIPIFSLSKYKEYNTILLPNIWTINGNYLNQKQQVKNSDIR